jgi:hypothetical protein
MQIPCQHDIKQKSAPLLTLCLPDGRCLPDKKLPEWQKFPVGVFIVLT